jgi:hypothetical protein
MQTTHRQRVALPVIELANAVGSTASIEGAILPREQHETTGRGDSTGRPEYTVATVLIPTGRRSMITFR